jgi:hypothetical protein
MVELLTWPEVALIGIGALVFMFVVVLIVLIVLWNTP